MKLVSTTLVMAALVGCGGEKQPAGVSPRRVADAVYAVISADRLTYTREVVNRLTDAKVVRATEHWKDEQTLPLPAQMLRMGAALVQKGEHGVSYSLLSLWPINKQNASRTTVETDGLKQVAAGGAPVYADEVLGGKSYLTAVYPDKATVPACVDCHNANADSPRHDFKLGDVMGGVVVRIALE